MKSTIINTLAEIFKTEFQCDIPVLESYLQRTKKEFEGDITLVIFPFVKALKMQPATLGEALAQSLTQRLPHLIAGSNVVGGFLNLSISSSYWLSKMYNNEIAPPHTHDNPSPVVIEFSSPNTNKPLHLGHVRNNVLGASVAAIVAKAGKPVVKVNLVNDRGIHICKSMLAWVKAGEGETPESSGLKGDHLVGKYYVKYDQMLKAESNEGALAAEAQEYLRKWEENDPEIRALWKNMNNWVYAGFDKTYERMGISFDKIYYESDTYLLGKQLVEVGLRKGAFFRKDDGSVWVDLTQEGFDEKLLLRADQTSVYITQDLGTAELRYDDYTPSKMIYVVGNEQNYHFDILKVILDKKLEKPSGAIIHHLSYGMVELPFGKMKSREGTVVDADDLMETMVQKAKESTESLGKSNFEAEEAAALYEMMGIGALKYFILKVDPKKSMLFNPEESIDLNGNTAPFIQYTHARIRSLIRKATEQNIDLTLPCEATTVRKGEKEMIKLIVEYPTVVQQAAEALSPALIANYVFDLAKDFNRFYQETPIFKEENQEIQRLRLQISAATARTIKEGFELLGINVPERM